MLFEFLWFFTNSFVVFVYYFIYVSMGRVLQGRCLLVLVAMLGVQYERRVVCVGPWCGLWVRM